MCEDTKNLGRFGRPQSVERMSGWVRLQLLLNGYLALARLYNESHNGHFQSTRGDGLKAAKTAGKKILCPRYYPDNIEDNIRR